MFAYKTRSHEGRHVDGFLEADSEAAAVGILRARNLFVVDVRPATDAGGTSRFNISLESLFRPKVTLRELAIFCRQFSVMLEAGVPVFQSLNILAEQTEKSAFKQAIGKVVEQLEGGFGLAESFRLFPRIFPPVFTSMIEAGEVSGTLELVLGRLAVHFEKEHEIREQVRGAMMYPAVVLLIAFMAVTILMIWVIPGFEKLLADMKADLPLPTRFIFGVSRFVRHFWWAPPAVAVLFILSLKYFFGSTIGGKELWDRAVLRMPIVGTVARKVIIARFARTLGSMVKSGVPILAALEVVRKTAGNAVASRAIGETMESVSEGGAIAGLLEKSGVFPPMVTRMVAIGEETGAMESLLEKVATFYDQDVDQAVKRLTVTIEPVLIVLVGVVVGSIILSILIPMFSIYSSYR
ncbi:MAG: type II secretion system F family protein [Bacillota bacterium]